MGSSRKSTQWNKNNVRKHEPSYCQQAALIKDLEAAAYEDTLRLFGVAN